MEELIHLLPPRTVLDDEEPARIMGTGHIRNSYVSTSSIVEGYVEHSILFSHVRVGKNAKIINSIVMENNYIGNGALIQNSLICDGGELFSHIMPNIGEDVKIGEDDPRGSNLLYPDYLHGGITLIGQNVEIPGGLQISRNCYIGSKVGKAELKGLERVKAGDTVLQS
jgi:ADP-glucose pyrophosphorylase